MNLTHVWNYEADTKSNPIVWHDLLVKEPADVYHAQAVHHLSSHRLAAFRECPRLYRGMQLGDIRDEDRPAYVVGRAAHTLILEGRDTFQKHYAVGGPINPKTGSPYGSGTKAFAEWAEQLGKDVLSSDQAQLVERMNDAVRSHPLASELLANGIPEGVLRTSYRGMACQIRLDWIASDYGLVDLKTSDALPWFESDARRYSYVHQLAFYRAVVKEVTGQLLPVYLVAVEKREPYRCGVWLMGHDVLAAAERQNEEAIERLRECIDTNTWPTGYESLRTFDWL